jgi:glutathione S-transferase
MALFETGAVFGFKPIDLQKKEHKTPAFKELQPWSKVPVWADRDGFRLHESRAIMKHVAVGSALYPLNDPRFAATIEMWISIEYSYFQAAWGPIFQERILKKRANAKHVANETLCNEKTLELEKVLDQMEAQLRRTGEYIAGDSFSIADITFLPYFSLFEQAGLNETLPARPYLQAWVSRCLCRAAWQKVKENKVLDRVEK